MTKTFVHSIQGFLFTWDPQKEKGNRRKHRVSFEEACEVFFDEAYFMVEDTFAEGEQRWRLTGYSERNRLLTVVVAEFETAWRIIFARKATREERRGYEEEDDS